MKTIASIPDIRTEGSLIKDSSDSGFLQDEQINASLQRGQAMMLLRVASDYQTIRDYIGIDQPTLDQQAAYKKAECCFAIANMPLVLGSQQLAKTGLLKSKKTGQSEVTFSSDADTLAMKTNWEHQAYLALMPYIGNKVFSDKLDADGNFKDIGFRTKDRKLTIAGI